jgi:serine/threonine protein kinase
MDGLDALIGKQVGRYRLGKLLGYGGMGAVYLSAHESLARPVAIKVLLPALMKGPPRISFLDRFQDEARMVAELNHPHILPVYDFGIDEGIAYMVMGYASGGSLAAKLSPARGGGPLAVQKAARYLSQAATALDYAHSKGIVHRDVKPQNLLLEGTRLLLSDFGIARVVGKHEDKSNPASAPTITMNGAPLRGTPFYLAPEQVGTAPVDRRADIYALGVTLYQMLTGRIPFQDSGGGPWSVVLKHILEVPPPLVGQRIELTSEMESIVRKALAKEPDERYRSAGELALAFRRASERGRLLALPAKPVLTRPIPAVKLLPEHAVATEAGRICPQCGTVNRSTATWCMKDGTPLLPPGAFSERTAAREEYIRVCPVCGYLNRRGAKFCVQDGALLSKQSL